MNLKGGYKIIDLMAISLGLNDDLVDITEKGILEQFLTLAPYYYEKNKELKPILLRFKDGNYNFYCNMAYLKRGNYYLYIQSVVDFDACIFIRIEFDIEEETEQIYVKEAKYKVIDGYADMLIKMTDALNDNELPIVTTNTEQEITEKKDFNVGCLLVNGYDIIAELGDLISENCEEELDVDIVDDKLDIMGIKDGFIPLYIELTLTISNQNYYLVLFYDKGEIKIDNVQTSLTNATVNLVQLNTHYNSIKITADEFEQATLSSSTFDKLLWLPTNMIIDI